VYKTREFQIKHWAKFQVCPMFHYRVDTQMQLLQDVKEDTSLLTDDDDDDEMEDLDALAKGLDEGTPAVSPKPASAAETGNTPIWVSSVDWHSRS